MNDKELERKRNLISDAICDLSYKYIEDYQYEDEREINSGDCELFANDLINLINKKDSSIDIKKMSTCDFTKNEILEFECLFDKEKLESFFGFTFSDELINIMSENNPGYHVWVYAEGKFYDCESVDGVDNPFELEFFERSFAWLLLKEQYDESAFKYMLSKYNKEESKINIEAV